MRFPTQVVLSAVVALLALVGPAAVGAQPGQGQIRAEISNNWAEHRDLESGEVTLASPGYPYNEGCVINEIKMGGFSMEKQLFADMQFSQRVFVGPSGEGCNLIPRERYADVVDYVSLFDLMRFLQRVNTGDRIRSGNLGSAEERHVAHCVQQLVSGDARIARVGLALDFVDSNAYVAEILCDTLPAGHKVIARGTSSGEGAMVWKVISPPFHPD